MSTPSARTGGSLDARFKISAAVAPCVRRLLQVLLPFWQWCTPSSWCRACSEKAGFPPAAVFVLTCLVAGVGSLAMGIMGKPADGHRLRYLVDRFHRLQLGAGAASVFRWRSARYSLMGVLFTVISATGIRSWILRNLPQGVAHGTGIGIGLFLLLIAANGVGW